ncbi:MAG: 3-deoxy-7-phosphoheptulonate synthase [Candidatus Woesearchaeota archaeon]
MKLAVKEKPSIRFGNSEFGRDFIVIAGPCAIESEEQYMRTAEYVKSAGADMLRGAVYKPRSSPYSFQGVREEGLELLRKAKEKFGLPIVTEVMRPAQVEKVRDYIDMFQVGARNMQNFDLLEELGKEKKPVMLKRGISATIDEWLNSAEYMMKGGNKQIILCERGIRTFADRTRNTLDIAAIPIIKQETNLPIIADPSHATGRRELIIPMCRAAKAAGADGIMVETHIEPEKALCDGPQSLPKEMFLELMEEMKG